MHVLASPYRTAAGVEAGTGGLSAALDRVTPNPFAGKVEMRLILVRPGPVEVVIYDVLGRAVRSLAKDQWLTAGEHTLSWDGRRDGGAACTAGVYFIGARVEGHRLVRRVVKVE